MTQIGLDTLFLPKYTALVAAEIPAGWWFSSFVNIFGTSTTMKAIEAVLKTKKPGGVRIHAIWENNHTYVPKIHDPIIKEVYAAFKKLRAKYSCGFEFSPFCECNQDLSKILNTLSVDSGGITLVNSVWKGPMSKLYKNEVHSNGSKPMITPYNFSYDGQSAYDANVEADKTKYASAEVFYYWIPQFNCKYKLDDTTAINLRKNTLINKHIKALVALDAVKGTTRLDAKSLYKVVSEQYNTPPAGKECKPVFITPVKTNVVKLVAQDGVTIANLNYYGTYAGGGYRYYADIWGYEILARANAHGSPVVKVMAGTKSLGTLNPAFRENAYR